MRTTIASLLAGAALLLAAASCGRSDPPEGATGRIRLRVTMSHLLTFAPLHIARAEGYFEDAGLEIEEVEFKRSAQGIPALALGDLDVLGGTVTAGLFNAVARGAEIRIVAEKGHVGAEPDWYTGLLVRKALVDDGVLEDPACLRGLRLVTNRDNMAAFFVDHALARVGLRMEDLDLAVVPTSGRVAAAESGAADVISASEPWVTRLLDTGEMLLWMRDFEVIPDAQYACLTFGPSLLRERPEAGRRFMVAYLRGVRRYQEGKTPRNVEILAAATTLDADFLLRTPWPCLRADGQLRMESVLAFQAWAKEKGLLDRVLAPEEFWDPRFVEDACRALQAAEAR